MEVSNTILKDNGRLLQKIHQIDGDMATIEIHLPEYLDIVSLLALEKRMAEVAKASNKKLRLLANTTNLTVEKYATRLFATRDNIFLSIDWREQENV